MNSTSVKTFVRPAYSVRNRGGKVTLIMREILWTNNPNLVQDVPMMNLKFSINAITVPAGGSGITFVQTFKISFS